MGNAIPVKTTESIFNEIDKMRERVMHRAFEIFSSNGSLFGRDLDDWLQAEQQLVWKPAIELTEKDGAFRLELAAPGVDPKDIDIEITPEEVLIKAEVHHEHKEDKGQIHICEFAHGSLFRAVRLPKTINPEKVKAEFKNGMLMLNAAVAEEARARKVKIEAA